MKKIVLFLFSLILLFSFFTFKLDQVPDGLTIDESAFGLNGVLLAKTLRDQNNRFLPVFVLSIHGTDWRQPITQYQIVSFFKLFGPSVFNMRLTSVVSAIFSIYLIFILGNLLFKNGGLISALIFLVSPITLIFSHLALDLVTPIPFIILWLIFLYLFEKKLRVGYLLLAGIALGVAFYGYKGMRATVPVWGILTLIYIFYINYLEGKKFLKYLGTIKYFLFGFLPFILITPLLEAKYSGAVFNHQSLNSPFSDWLYFYLAHFDVSMLYVRGDKELLYSTQLHGMFLITTALLFFYGLHKIFTLKNTRFLKLIVFSLFLGPLFYGFVGSVSAHRLVFILPFYSIISCMGLINLLEFKNTWIRKSVILWIGLMLINFVMFVNYYWFEYPETTSHLFYSQKVSMAYQKLYEISSTNNLTPYLTHEIYQRSTNLDHEMFQRSIYFLETPKLWPEEVKDLPQNSIVLTEKKEVEGLERIESGFPDYYLYIRQ